MGFSCTWRVRGGRDSYASSAFSLYSNYLARCSALCDNFYMHGAQQTVVMMRGGLRKTTTICFTLQTHEMRRGWRWGRERRLGNVKREVVKLILKFPATKKLFYCDFYGRCLGNFKSWFRGICCANGVGARLSPSEDKLCKVFISRDNEAMTWFAGSSIKIRVSS